jgi:hypothetical protein
MFKHWFKKWMRFFVRKYAMVGLLEAFQVSLIKDDSDAKLILFFAAPAPNPGMNMNRKSKYVKFSVKFKKYPC